LVIGGAIIIIVAGILWQLYKIKKIKDEKDYQKQRGV
jgi:hypothetical protein